jgi:hypothetical protein
MRLALLALALLAFAGCGGGSDPAAGRSYAEGLVSALSGVEQPASVDDEGLAGLSADYGQAAEELVRLTPPADVADAHARMVASMRAYADDLGRASKLTHDPTGFANEMARAQTNAGAWTSAFEEIKASGYATVPTS